MTSPASFQLHSSQKRRRVYLQQLVHVVADVVVRQLLVKLLSENICWLEKLKAALIVSAHDRRRGGGVKRVNNGHGDRARMTSVKLEYLKICVIDALKDKRWCSGLQREDNTGLNGGERQVGGAHTGTHTRMAAVGMAMTGGGKLNSPPGP